MTKHRNYGAIALPSTARRTGVWITTRALAFAGIALMAADGGPAQAGAPDPASRVARAAAAAPETRDRRLDHWSFKPLRSVPLPVLKGTRPAAGPVDRFILSALARKGLTPAAPLARGKLIRRLYFDLVGLPPTPDEIDAFVRVPDPRAFETLVDRLLADPRFGERWARHWMDVARYADSNGIESDNDRPTAYHYRDFLIRAFNDDLPYDTFVRWQIAGDEEEPDNPQAVSATGFLTAGPSTILDVPMEEEKIRNRLNELDDILSTTGSALLGLTVACARCHDHKYDPIPTRDYYRLMAAFNSGDRAEVPLLPQAEVAKRRQAESEWKSRAAAATRELDAWLSRDVKPLLKQIRRSRIDALPIDPEQKKLLTESPQEPRARELEKRYAKQLKVEDGDCRPLLSDTQRARWDELSAHVRAVDAQKPAPMPTAFAMADFGSKPRETWLLDRGDLHVKREPVELGFLTALTRGKSPSTYWTEARAGGSRGDTTYQRRAVAAWVTDTRHGAGALLARVIVNRLWQHHFGEGLVRTPNDFGLRGEEPTHPALLEWLASELVRGGWKLKPIHRLILNSAAYRQGTGFDSKKARIDPDNRLLWRRRPRRIEAEAFRDAVLAVSGALNEKRFGPGFKAPIPAEAIQARNVTDPYPKDVKETPETLRRTVYMFHKRVVPYPLLQAFDRPDPQASCGRRSVTTVAPQALAVLNEPFIRLRAGDFARRVRAEAGEQLAAQVDRAYRLALGRPPSASERDESIRFLEAQAARRTARDPSADGRVLGLTDLAQVLFGLNEFMYVD